MSSMRVSPVESGVVTSGNIRLRLTAKANSWNVAALYFIFYFDLMSNSRGRWCDWPCDSRISRPELVATKNWKLRATRRVVRTTDWHDARVATLMRHVSHQMKPTSCIYVSVESSASRAEDYHQRWFIWIYAWNIRRTETVREKVGLTDITNDPCALVQVNSIFPLRSRRAATKFQQR